MPFQSEEQRKYLWANEPEIAKRWEKYPKGYNTGGVSHLFRSKEPAQGGYIRPEDSGVLGLADGGRIGFQYGSPHEEAAASRAGTHAGENRAREERQRDDHWQQTAGQSYVAPVETVAPTRDDRPDPHGGDWELGWLDKSLRPGTEEYRLKEKYDDDDKGYYGQKKIQYGEKVLTDKTNEYILRNLKKLDPAKYYEDMNAFKKFIEMGMSIPMPTVLGLLKAFDDENKLTSEE